MKIWRILLGVLSICLFSHCSHRRYDTCDWYESMVGYNNVVQLTKKNASILGNAFFYGEIHYYSIWSYYTINNKTYLIVRKFQKKDLISYRIYQYSKNLKWLKQFDHRDVSSYIFRNFAALDDIPLVFDLKTGNKITTYNFYPAFYAYIASDTIENEFLKNLRNDIIKYNLIDFSNFHSNQK